MNTKKKVTTIFALVVMMVTLVIGGYQVIKATSGGSNVGNVGFETNDNYYVIRSNATEYQKEIYVALIDSINNKDDKNTVGLIAQNFVADFFTWTNKVRLNDVGGLQFIHPDAVNSVSHSAQDGIYNDMYTYLSEGKIEDTLQVKTSTVQVVQKPFKIDDEEVDAYYVGIKWEYEDASALNTSVYQNKATIVLTPDSDGLFSIVEVSDYEF